MAVQNDGMKSAGHFYGPNDGFVSALEWMRYLTDIIGLQQKARIVIEYDPSRKKCETEIFISEDAPFPQDIR